jgi:Icc-related predicted phosphoesterase
MKIIGLPDIHGDINKINRLVNQITDADLVVLTGDITNFGHRAEMKEMIDLIKGSNQHCFAVPGNCDYQETEEVMKQTETNLNGTNRILGNTTFIGLGGSLPTPFDGTPFEVSEDYFQGKLKTAIEGMNTELPLVLVSHQPPYGTCADCLPNGMHVGSTTVRQFIEDHQPLICFTGHIHEGKGIDSIGNTKIINPGPFFKGNYAYAEISDQVDLVEIRPIPYR